MGKSGFTHSEAVVSTHWPWGHTLSNPRWKSGFPTRVLQESLSFLRGTRQKENGHPEGWPLIQSVTQTGRAGHVISR
ncbi:hypothetical protein GCM10011498_39020 [Amylibacter cionae]|uniref:Uncharacterized protein n=1 Tax=Neptunicoccus cionae TaxID=2035344 RepID=A0A916R6K0_9RHOB|nr:hypothetical protein GCM10011498_39020 [Amylibacter cionae]